VLRVHSDTRKKSTAMKFDLIPVIVGSSPMPLQPEGVVDLGKIEHRQTKKRTFLLSTSICGHSVTSGNSNVFLCSSFTECRVHRQHTVAEDTLGDDHLPGSE
jgi:aminopeptidase-like protein